ncbi:Hypothetical predicted protein [Mytilus galloprovincialis]|uniref:Integrase catalytic domain-containing protein n=1 Tax=Mytilus galloprovincialis TaxID=29158 RepID=A0A8B6H9G5_MYTGA|nr:Hypothetical predicted protein [Mytilus galloprovincialis]
MVTRSRIRESLHRIDEIGIKDRKKRRLHRRIYNVDGVNHIWHIDSNHKLIRWNFIVLGGIDGFSRFVTFLNCRDNNKATTVLDSFKTAVVNYGLPLRVRSDKGQENSLVADFMIKERGPNRGTGMINNPTDFDILDIGNYGTEGNYEDNFNDYDGIQDTRPILDSRAFSVNEICQEELNLHCPRNWASSYYGIDIYHQAVQIIERNS